MDVFKYLILVSVMSSRVGADTYSVKIATEQFINVVDSKFLSFTIDPVYLFSSSEKYTTKECICMASSLAPAYIQIAGPSTATMTFKNATIAIENRDPEKASVELTGNHGEETITRTKRSLSVSHVQWERFVRWVKNTGFDLVFALNNEEKTASGMWDPNTALKILTSADDADVGDIFWQLGYECRNQSIEEYLNDLETLSVIIETFPPGKSGQWKVVGGDVTHCLQADSKSDFKDYVTLSNDMLDAILLNGNSSSQELDRMSEKDRLKLLKLLSQSVTPLWLTEHNQIFSELERAADWMTSLGFSARNGFSVHYRELMEQELYEPTLSFYMALLFKNLVGEKVLNVDIEADQAILFAHCTSLRHKPVPGAVTFYGANMDDEPARFSIKLSKKEDGGDILQFILGHDHNGNIVVNGRAMFYEGDIRPVVKRVRPYKTLLINLPAKSFGFWVLANTQVEACYENDKNEDDNYVEAISVKDEDEENELNAIKTKRSIPNTKDSDDHLVVFGEVLNETQYLNTGKENVALKERISNINNNLKSIQQIFKNNANSLKDLNEIIRTRRHMPTYENIGNTMKRTRTHVRPSKIHKSKIADKTSGSHLLNRLSQRSKLNIERRKNKKERKSLRNAKKYPKNSKIKSNEAYCRSDELGLDERSISNKNRKDERNYRSFNKKPFTTVELMNLGENTRNRRSIDSVNKHTAKKKGGESSENEINVESKETFKLGKLIHKLKKLGDAPMEIDNDALNDYDENQNSSEGLVLKTEVTDNTAQIHISDKSSQGLLKATLQDVITLLSDFNKHLNRFWNAITVLE